MVQVPMLVLVRVTLRVTFLTLGVVLSTVAPLHAGPSQLIRIEAIRETDADYSIYELRQTKRIDLSDLVLARELVAGVQWPVYWQLDVFRRQLLERGLATLRDPATAKPAEREAQRLGEQAGIGLWAKRPAAGAPPPNSGRTGGTISAKGGADDAGWLTKEIGETWAVLTAALSSAWDIASKWLSYLLSIGLLTVVGGLVYKRYYVQRRVRMLIFGDISVGKSALFERLLDPNVEQDLVFNLSPSNAPRSVKRRTFIPWGRFEIYPALTDVPGVAQGAVWDQFLGGRLHVITMVLAPTRTNVRKDTNIVDREYVNIQFGLVKAYIEGGFASSAVTRPRAAVVFLNKFDLFSDTPPDDSASSEARRRFQEIFEQHIESASLAAKKARVPFAVITGSALKGWNCDRVMAHVGDSLFGR